MASTIKVTHKFIDGAHFFVSDDKEALGLCVAHADLKTAYEEVGNQLDALFEYNHGKKTKFSPTVPFDEFKKFVETVKSIAEETEPSGTINPSSIQPWMYTNPV
jgi:hypothetical protein